MCICMSPPQTFSCPHPCGEKQALRPACPTPTTYIYKCPSHPTKPPQKLGRVPYTVFRSSTMAFCVNSWWIGLMGTDGYSR